jgi:hypothetical protein
VADLIDTDYLEAAIPALAGRSDLAELVTVASVMVENYCGRIFAYQAATVDYLDGTGTPRIWVLRPPIIAIASVVYNGTTLTEGSDFIADDCMGRLTRGDGRTDPDKLGLAWCSGTRNVVVTYNGGYEEIPAPVKMATALAAQGIVNASGAPFQSERMDNYSYTRASSESDLPTASMALLAPYRRVPIGGRG